MRNTANPESRSFRGSRISDTYVIRSSPHNLGIAYCSYLRRGSNLDRNSHESKALAGGHAIFLRNSSSHIARTAPETATAATARTRETLRDVMRIAAAAARIFSSSLASREMIRVRIFAASDRSQGLPRHSSPPSRCPSNDIVHQMVWIEVVGGESQQQTTVLRIYSI